MAKFLDEWDRLWIDASLTHGDRDFIRAASALALRCQEEVHTYLKFDGD
jgi:hypothetical protein